VAGSARQADDRALSTAGSLLVIFVGLYLAFGSLYTATANTGERVDTARDLARETSTAVAETDLSVESAVWNDSSNESLTNLTVEVTNVGDRSLRLSDLDTLVDGAYLSIDAYEQVDVDGRDTDIWRPGERLFLRDEDTIDDRGGSPSRVKIVSDVGVATVSGVTTR
jgi:flagellar protein FlaF